jgi:hypothetical protein
VRLQVLICSSPLCSPSSRTQRVTKPLSSLKISAAIKVRADLCTESRVLKLLVFYAEPELSKR